MYTYTIYILICSHTHTCALIASRGPPPRQAKLLPLEVPVRLAGAVAPNDGTEVILVEDADIPRLVRPRCKIIFDLLESVLVDLPNVLVAGGVGALLVDKSCITH